MSRRPTGPAAEPAAAPGRAPGDGAGRLAAEVDLSFEVTDATGGRSSGHLVGTEQRLRLDVTDPAVMIAAAGRGGTRGWGERLANAGVHAELHGPRGRIARLDPDRTSVLGGLLAGSRHVTLDRAGWAPTVRAVLPSGSAPWAVPTALVAVALGGVWLRHRWRGGG